MSGGGTGMFDPRRIADRRRLSAAINRAPAPPPIAEPVIVTDDGHVRLPVPDHDPPARVDSRSLAAMFERKSILAELHLGLTLQWAPLPDQDGLVVEFRGGAPDGDETRDAVAVFLTRDGLAGLARDLAAIAAVLDAAE